MTRFQLQGSMPLPRQGQWLRFAALASVLWIGACSTFNDLQPSPNQPQEAEPPTEQDSVLIYDKTMVDDILEITAQVFAPVSTTLQFSIRENDALLQYFISRFSEMGYGIQRVSADQGSNYFSYARTDTNAAGQSQVRFNVSIGAVDIGRDYKISADNTVTPVSAVRLSGTRVPVTVNDVRSARMSVADQDLSRPIYVASLNLDEQAPPVISLITDDLVDRVAAQSALRLQQRVPEKASVHALNSNRVEITNLLYTGGDSNFASLLEDYDTVERKSIIFANDSLVLGDTNKLLIEQMLADKLKDDDLISLVGCSTGPTALEIGNEGLALGRAERITQELLAQGVSRERILDEGCWAPVAAGEDLPARGVVMEIWRRPS